VISTSDSESTPAGSTSEWPTIRDPAGCERADIELRGSPVLEDDELQRKLSRTWSANLVQRVEALIAQNDPS